MCSLSLFFLIFLHFCAPERLSLTIEGLSRYIHFHFVFVLFNEFQNVSSTNELMSSISAKK